jgi:RNA polymerase sigma-70 factor (ECF subfamily)
LASDFDTVLIERVRRSDQDAWSELIGRFEGRLLAFVESRLRNRATAEDVVQDTFVGFLNSLPNYDASRSLESYLFSIAAHKLTDYLRREGRRPAVPLVPTGSSQSEWDPPSPLRGASSLMRSGERLRLEEVSLARALGELIHRWRERGEWQKLECTELLFVRGWANKDVAERLGLSEQAVANYKFDFLARLRASVRKQGLSTDVFPELA